MQGLTLKEVSTGTDLNTFMSFPGSLYKGHPCWVPPILSDEKFTLGPRNPALKTCERRMWLVYRNGKPAGRICGIINHIYIQKWKNSYARFGWIDFVDDREVSALLLGAVESWAAERGMSAIHGPLGFTDFDPEGMLTHGFNETASMTTIYNYPYYPEHLEALGYRKDADWLEYDIEIPGAMPERIIRLSAAVEQRYQLRSLKLTKRKQLLAYAGEIFQVLNLAYKDLYGVVPLSGEQISAYTRQYLSFIRPEYVSLVVDEHKRVAAFAISIPSLSKALQRIGGKLFPFGFVKVLLALHRNTAADLYLIAIRPDMQLKGLNALLIRDLGETFIRNGIVKASTHPALENNNKVLLLWKGFRTKLTKKRRCYLKEISRR